MGCVESMPDSTTALVIEPANIDITVVDGQPIAQAYRALAVHSDGSTDDVTAETTFVATGSSSWAGAELTVDGKTVGPMRVTAAYAGMQAEAGVTVYARTNRLLDAPADAAARFADAVTDPTCVPDISYPADGVVMPPNLGKLDVQWIDTRNDLFEIAVATTYVDTRIYTRTAPWTKLGVTDWNQLAAQHEPIELRVSGIVERVPQLRCNSATAHIAVTDQPLTGNLYFANSNGVQRANVATPNLAAESIFSAALWDAMFAPLVGGDAASCYGCAISRDGSQLAIPSQTTGAIYDFATHTLTAPTQQSWSWAAFSANGDKLITAADGDLSIITSTGYPLTSIAHTTGIDALDPQISPDGRLVVNVEALNGETQESPPADAPSLATLDPSLQTAPFGATLVVRQFFDGSNEMGSRTALLPLEPGVAAYFPAWSPDGRYIVFTRASGWGTVATTASLWIMRADGSEAPIELTAPSEHLDVRAHFVPAMMSVGGKPIYMIAFESRQAFGEVEAEGRLQVWAMAFAPTFRAAWPAMRLPMQSLALDNHMLSWID
jgi:hypothetical protein